MERGRSMNERIKELAEQATEYANEQNELYGVGYVITFKEKFAELIVRECVAICQDVDGEEDAMVKCGRQVCAVEIREHFGVEE
jgi:hypothetical protein